ncbi:MAG TPA: ribonuclease P protein component [Rectinemataceae bacterium]
MSPAGEDGRVDLGFPKECRIGAGKEIDRIFRFGARFSRKGMALRVLRRNSQGPSRVVLAPVKSFRGSVERNRAKRLAREVWRLNRSRVAQGWDLAFVLYPELDGFAAYSESMLSLLDKAGLMR